MSESIQFNLTNDEALVLYDFLSRFSDTDVLEIQHQSEARALWNLNCLLERALSEQFYEDWSVALEAARDRLKDDS